MSTEKICEATDDDEVECLSCEDTGWVVTPGDMKIPCSDCRTGDMNFYHQREKDLAAMIHVDELIPGIDPEYHDHPLPYA